MKKAAPQIGTGDEALMDQPPQEKKSAQTHVHEAAQDSIALAGHPTASQV